MQIFSNIFLPIHILIICLEIIFFKLGNIFQYYLTNDNNIAMGHNELIREAGTYRPTAMGYWSTTVCHYSCHNSKHLPWSNRDFDAQLRSTKFTSCPISYRYNTSQGHFIIIYIDMDDFAGAFLDRYGEKRSQEIQSWSL